MLTQHNTTTLTAPILHGVLLLPIYEANYVDIHYPAAAAVESVALPACCHIIIIYTSHIGPPVQIHYVTYNQAI